MQISFPYTILETSKLINFKENNTDIFDRNVWPRLTMRLQFGTQLCVDMKSKSVLRVITLIHK